MKNSLQFVEIIEQDQTYQLEKLDRRELPFPLTLKAFTEPNQFDLLHNLFVELATQDQLSGEVSIVVDNSLAIVKKLAIDVDMDDQELDEQIQWECKQFIPETSLANYRYIYQKLPHSSEENREYLLVIAFREQLIDGIKRLLEDMKLSLSQVEVDWFALIRAGNCFYEADKKRLVCLANVGVEVVQLLFLQYGEYYFSHHISLQEPEEGSELPAWDAPENLSRLLKKEIRRILMENHFGIESQPIENLYLFGERAEPELVEFLRDETILHVDLALLEDKLRIDEELKNSPAYSQFSYEYLYSIGTALPQMI